VEAGRVRVLDHSLSRPISSPIVEERGIDSSIALIR
jgi:hypothetical protein